MPAGPTAAPLDIQRFLLEIVDSFEKLELALQHAAASAGAPIGDAGASADVADGVVAGSRAQGWTLDEASSWASAAHALARLNAGDRAAVVNLVSSSGWSGSRDDHLLVYGIRLIAFIALIVGIVDNNHRGGGG